MSIVNPAPQGAPQFVTGNPEPVAPQTSPNIPGSSPGTQFGPAPAKAEPDTAKDPANRESHVAEPNAAPVSPHRDDRKP